MLVPVPEIRLFFCVRDLDSGEVLRLQMPESSQAPPGKHPVWTVPHAAPPYGLDPASWISLVFSSGTRAAAWPQRCGGPFIPWHQCALVIWPLPNVHDTVPLPLPFRHTSLPSLLTDVRLFMLAGPRFMTELARCRWLRFPFVPPPGANILHVLFTTGCPPRIRIETLEPFIVKA